MLKVKAKQFIYFFMFPKELSPHVCATQHAVTTCDLYKKGLSRLRKALSYVLHPVQRAGLLDDSDSNHNLCS